MSSSRHLETDILTERVNNMFQQLLRCFGCYDGSNWTYILPHVDFAYNATKALGIEHSLFEANCGFSHDEVSDMMFSMRPSIPVSQDASQRLKLLQVLHAMVRTVYQVHTDKMQARSKPSTALHFVRGDKVSIVSKNIFLQRHPNRKLHDRQLGPFTIEEQIGKHIYILRLPTTVRLHPVFHASNPRPCSTV
jgi:hypothetical protein